VVHQVVPTVGTLAPRKSSLLGSQVAGRVEKVFVEVGDVVKEGQELVQLETKFFDIELNLRRAELAAAQARAEQAVSTLKRHQEISTRNPQAISAQAVDEARTASELAAAQMVQAQQALVNAEERLKEAVIRAPFDGVIVERMVDAGDPVTTTFVTQVLRIEQLDVLELLFTLPQEVYGQVKPGTLVQFNVNGVPELSGSGEIDIVFPSFDEATRSFRCRVIFENSDLRFRPGMLMQVQAVVGEAAGILVVPKNALIPRDGREFVRVPTESGYEEREVRVGMRGLDTVEVLGGISEGEKVLAFDVAGLNVGGRPE
jgi:membrane fusion protein (multidrug efflux system)